MEIRTHNYAALLPFVIASVLLLGCGCGREQAGDAGAKGEPATEAQEGEQQDILSQLFYEAENLFANGSTNETLALLEGALDNQDYAQHRRQVFAMLIRILLYTEQVDAASERMINAYAAGDEIAGDAMGAVYFYHMERGDAAGAAAWTERVLATEGITDAVRRNMREWNLMAHIQLGSADKIVAICDSLFMNAPGGDAIVILNRAIDMLFDRRQTDLVEKILAGASRTVTSDAGTRNLIMTTRLRLLAEQGKWDALAKIFPSAAETLPDAELLRAFRRVINAANQAKNGKVVDEMCSMVITNFAGKTSTAALAARQWADSAARNEPASLPDRLTALLNKDFPVNLVSGIFMRYFYDISDDQALVREMKDIGERIIPLLQDEDTKGSVMTMVLDSCFILEDYDSALAILRAGVHGYDAPWHEMAIAKVEAHKALAENRPVDAIKFFRAFMATVEVSKDGDAADPSTGVVHTREMILGRNAKRIGDIYRDLVKDPVQAASAYAEARAYYQKTLDTKPDKEVVDIINSEMATIPAQQ